jgi:cell division protein FtsB
LAFWSSDSSSSSSSFSSLASASSPYLVHPAISEQAVSQQPFPIQLALIPFINENKSLRDEREFLLTRIRILDSNSQQEIKDLRTQHERDIIGLQKENLELKNENKKLRDQVKLLEDRLLNVETELKLTKNDMEYRTSLFLVAESIPIIEDAARLALRLPKKDRMGIVDMRNRFDNLSTGVHPMLSPEQATDWQTFVATHGMNDAMIDFLCDLKSTRMKIAHAESLKSTTTMKDLEARFRSIVSPVDEPFVAPVMNLVHLFSKDKNYPLK